MEIDFQRGTDMVKALADETRIRIVHILSCSELCACDVKSYFELSQPTLSHHLSLLVNASLVKMRREGKWVYYSLSNEGFEEFGKFVRDISKPNTTCLCKRIGSACDEKN